VPEVGDPKKQRKKYETHKNPWRKEQIEAETTLLGEYGLRNKRELWRYRTMLSQTRGIARSLLGKSEEERSLIENDFLKKLSRLGILGEKTMIDDVLDLSIRDMLERRLQTVIFRLGLAKTVHQARQLIIHGHIEVSGRIVRVPGYLVKRSDETNIKYTHNSVLSDETHPIRKLNKSVGSPEPEKG
jgi:small subunit ribosomal protein S4